MDAVRQSLRGTLLLAGPLIVVAIVGATMLAPADERVVVFFFVTLVLALAIQVFSGPTGIMSFGHVAFLGVGAYVGALLTVPPGIRGTIAPSLPGFVADLELPLIAAMLVAFVVTGVVAGLIGLTISRMEEIAMSMATLSLLLVVAVLFSAADGLTGGAQGVFAIPRDTTMPLACASALVMVFLAQWFARSRIGVQLRASRSAPLAARSLGVRLVRLRWVAWTLAGALIGAGGALWAGYSIAFSPREFGFELTFSLLAALVVGGIYSVTGSVAGVALMTVLFEVTRRIEASLDIPSLTQLVVAIAILAILIRRPNGLLGFRELPETMKRRRREPAADGTE
jgi:branched-chain amino acid transport system permease protein